MTVQVTLITCHKGVDLHAATAERVMKDRLRDGQLLHALRRAEFHTFWCGDQTLAPDGRSRAEVRGTRPAAPALEELLDSGRYYNPNKHHYGHFRLAAAAAPWYEQSALPEGEDPPAGWPGSPGGGDLGAVDAGLYDRLLGGLPGADLCTWDVCAYPRGERGPLLSGVIWRLVIAAPPAAAGRLAMSLAVSRRRGEGLLVNPHMQQWLLAPRGAARPAGESPPGGGRRRA